jgi:hypothetical protein
MPNNSSTAIIAQHPNCVAGIVPNGHVTMVQEIQQIYKAFALLFMDRTAWRKQKHYMASGSIQKPKPWSTCQVATRLTTHNCYLSYLPGTAQSLTDEKMKDMLVDMHSPAYHHLMAPRANYNIDAHTYLEITKYLQNLGLIKESFNKANAQNKQHGNSKQKAHKAQKNHCRKHLNGEHTWADCFNNPKGKNYRAIRMPTKTTMPSIRTTSRTLTWIRSLQLSISMKMG